MKYKVMDEKGRSMIEMLGVLAIVGVLSVAGIAGYSKAMAKYKINKVMDQVSTLAANTKTLFAAVNSYKGLTGTNDVPANQKAYKLGLFPEDMVKACSKSGAKFVTGGTGGTATKNCVTNGMNGDTNIASSTDGKSFKIEMTGLTKEGCTALMTSDWGGAAGFMGVKGTTADTTNCKTTVDGNSNFCSPADIAAKGVYTIAKTSCSSADANTVTWYFY